MGSSATLSPTPFNARPFAGLLSLSLSLISLCPSVHNHHHAIISHQTTSPLLDDLNLIAISKLSHGRVGKRKRDCLCRDGGIRGGGFLETCTVHDKRSRNYMPVFKGSDCNTPIILPTLLSSQSRERGAQRPFVPRKGRVESSRAEPSRGRVGAVGTEGGGVSRGKGRTNTMAPGSRGPTCPCDGTCEHAQDKGGPARSPHSPTPTPRNHLHFLPPPGPTLHSTPFPILPTLHGIQFSV